MKSLFISFIFCCCNGIVHSQDLTTPFERNRNHSATYWECISYYKMLDTKFKKLNIIEAGPSDVGEPIHLVIIDENGQKDPQKIRKSKKAIVWINNGIHPGEPEGIDASMMLARDLLTKLEFSEILKKVTLIIVPVYNIGGCLTRNEHTRANQNGPESYGFRGNLNNLDLNRDFIKQDSRNAKTFATQFQQWQPEIFVDNHTTDGADYQYNITMLASMRSKMNPKISEFMYNNMLPELYKSMKIENDEMIPYVNYEESLQQGISSFHDKARFSSGYAALFHAMPFVVETHMLKAFNIRVQSTYNIVKHIVLFTAKHADQIRFIKKLAIEETIRDSVFSFKWKIDYSRKEMLDFRTFQFSKKYYPFLKDSMDYYDRNKPVNMQIPYYENFIPYQYVIKPKYYIVPQAYHGVIESLIRNGVAIQKLKKDTIITANYYRILDYKSPLIPYENHFLHSQIRVKESIMNYPYYKGDYIISTDQERIKFILESLEPESDDSYFAWNFFDGILMRKEYFSDFLFAPQAEEELRLRPELNKALKEFVAKDSINNSSLNRKLEFIYENSKFAEPYYCLYPVARIM